VHRPSVSVTLRAIHVAARYIAADLEPVRAAERPKPGDAPAGGLLDSHLGSPLGE
jgi:hypothetical protein